MPPSTAWVLSMRMDMAYQRTRSRLVIGIGLQHIGEMRMPKSDCRAPSKTRGSRINPARYVKFKWPRFLEQRY